MIRKCRCLGLFMQRHFVAVLIQLGSESTRKDISGYQFFSIGIQISL